MGCVLWLAGHGGPTAGSASEAVGHFGTCHQGCPSSNWPQKIQALEEADGRAALGLCGMLAAPGGREGTKNLCPERDKSLLVYHS